MLTGLLTILALNFAGMLTPGPDVLLVMRTAVRSRRHAIATAAGIATGNLIWVSFTIIGVAALFATHPAVITAVRLIGGIWLIWLGYRLITSALKGLRRTSHTPRTEPADPITEPTTETGGIGRAFTAGLGTNLSNPKYVLYLMSLFAPFVPPDMSLGNAMILIVTLSVEALTFFCVLGLVVSTPLIQTKLLRWADAIDFGAGIIFISVGTGFFLSAIM